MPPCRRSHVTSREKICTSDQERRLARLNTRLAWKKYATKSETNYCMCWKINDILDFIQTIITLVSDMYIIYNNIIK